MHVEHPSIPVSGSCPELKPSGSANLVLVVDDDPDLVDVTRFALENEGFTVETAENGAEALALLNAGSRPALVLLDLMMPVMDGWKFLEEVARAPALKAIPVVVLSAVVGAEIPSGAVAFVRKPISLRALVDVIDRHRLVDKEARG